MRTTGTIGGVSFERSVVYPVGDVPNMDYELPSAATFQDGALMMTPELLRRVKFLTVEKVHVTSDDGSETATYNGVPISLPAIEMLVPRDIKMEEGGWKRSDRRGVNELFTYRHNAHKQTVHPHELLYQ